MVSNVARYTWALMARNARKICARAGQAARALDPHSIVRVIGADITGGSCGMWL